MLNTRKQKMPIISFISLKFYTHVKNTEERESEGVKEGKRDRGKKGE